MTPWVLVVGVAFAAGWLLSSASVERAEKETLPPETGLAKRDGATVMVTVEPVTFRPVQRAVEGMGTLHGFEEITLAARVEGRVRKLHFDVSDRLKPDELLLEIDPTDYDLAVQQAERALQVELARLGLKDIPSKDFDLKSVPTVVQAATRLANLKSKLVRAEDLWKDRSIAMEELNNARADFGIGEAEYANQLLLAQAGLATIQLKQAALAVAKQQLKDTQIRVPTPTRPVPGAEEGVFYAVTQRTVAEGTLLRVGTEVGKLVINQTLKLRVAIPERYSGDVQLGQKAEVSTAAFSRPFSGTVTRINPAVEPTTRTFEVEIQVANPRGDLKPGSFAKAAVLTRLDAEAATVPLSAVVSFAGVNKVFLLDGGKAKEVQVTLGVQSTEWIEITRPKLPRDAQVVTSGQTVFADQTPVVVRAPAKSAASAR